ncbi:MAG TPA: radical SAM protein, partial [Chitinophagales bacterium]|nr:radical SAM protein [Chitinophagales bacterium]
MFLESLFKRKTNYNSLAKPLLKEYNQHRPLGPQKYACYAPFKSIYFGHHGRAIACCYNRTHLLGEYPKNSIKDIWFGAEADKLREFIKHDDLSLGCTGCKQQLVAGNFDAVKAKQYDERTMNRNRYPSVMEFELSNICNLECEMCSGDFSSLIRTKREKLPPLAMAYDDAFVKQLEEFIPYLDEVKFYGGEPFLIEIYYQIWEKIMEINPKVRISVQTNATVLNNRVKRILENTDFHINVSFDSLQKETYESIRINADFERTLENMKWFRDYAKSRNTFFGISACAMQQNWRELPAFIRFCNEWDVPVYF